MYLVLKHFDCSRNQNRNLKDKISMRAEAYKYSHAEHQARNSFDKDLPSLSAGHHHVHELSSSC